MTGLLSTDALQSLFSSVFGVIFEDGTLERYAMQRQENGTVLPVLVSSQPIKIQIDRCTEAMRMAPGYTATDVKLIILQDGGGDPDTDAVILARGAKWKIHEVYSDPARTQWVGRGVRQKS